ncbi:MAG: FAD-dependent oxidoreductase, partial [Propionibacteriaceae bacterium]|nr:FAD-dependent oxidoreductase [Propionibacteriaceae bacterium]
MVTHVDVMVLGGGPGGYVAAIRAAQLGRTVAIVEGRWWGGVCLNVGCIPTKTLLRNAEVADLVMRHAGTYGISGDVRVDYEPGWRRSRQVAGAMAKGVRFLMKKNNITAIDGWGAFTGPHSMTVMGQDQVPTRWTFDSAIIATGATSKTLPDVTVGGRIMTYDHLILSPTVPKSIIIAGAGAIGVEFATVLSSFGSQVTIVEYLDRLVPSEDETISAELGRAFRKRDIKALTGMAVQKVDET